MVRVLVRGVMALVLLLGAAVAVAAPASAATPGITSVSPASGSTLGGTRVTLSGHDFTQVRQVRFNSGPGTFLHIVSSGTMLVSAPAHPAGIVGIWLDLTNGQAVNTGRTFTYTTPPAPTVTSVSPATGTALGGTRVTISGTGFDQVKQVRFNSGPGTFLHIVSSGTMLVSAPAHPAGVVGIWLDLTNGQAVNTGRTYTYTTPPPGTPSNVHATGGTNTGSVSWTNPSGSDVAGTRVCRGVGDTAPVPATCSPGWTLGKGVHGYTDNTVGSGGWHYWVFAFNTSGGYSTPAVAGVTVRGKPAPGPVVATNATNATADFLPTTQIDGVAWTQTIVGNTVYVGGRFGHARPFGAAPGTSQVIRDNLLAYDITTGNLITTWAPSANGQVLSMAVNPSHTRLYVGGNFTEINNESHPYLAAFDLATGQLIPSFAPQLNSTVRAVTASDVAVYAGGDFSAVGTTRRTHLAAFDPAGTLTTWAPSTNEGVRSMLLTPDGARVVVGGGFATLNGVQVNGIGAVSSYNAVLVPWHTSDVVYSYGHSDAPTSGGAVLSLSTDGVNIYGTEYNYGSAPGGFEGMFAASLLDGTVRWIEDCHGDTYGAYPYLGTVYIVGHPHWCGNDNGWENPNRTEFLTRRAMAFTTTQTGTLSTVTEREHSPRAGLPSPSIVDWFPRLTPGTASGQSQAAWAITGSGPYVVLAGEFPQVNGISQQGLVRFAARPVSPAKNGPQGGMSAFVPTTSRSGSAVVVSSPTVWDADSLVLTYTLLRDSVPVTSTTVASTFWSQPRVTLTDAKPTAGSHVYSIRATDSDGNPLRSSPVTVKV